MSCSQPGDFGAQVEPTKRRLEVYEDELLSSKRARINRDGEQSEDRSQTEPTPKEPKPLKRPYISFLEKSVGAGANTFLSDWLDSLGSDREKHSRSDSYLQRSPSLISRQLTTSAPEMGKRRDAEGFAVPLPPPTPASTGSVAPSGSVASSTESGRSSGRNLVEDPFYRDANLSANHIYMRRREDYPEHVASIVQHVGQSRTSPGPSADDVRNDVGLQRLEDRVAETEVEDYFRRKIFPSSDEPGVLRRIDRQPMARASIPTTGSSYKVSTPVPDMLYGYSDTDAFTEAQQAPSVPMGYTRMANSERLAYPFLFIEFKGEGGSLWVATNQCLGVSSSCVHMAERLNSQLTECEADEKQNELDYYTKKVESFALQRPDDYLEFRKYVRNIIDWGKDRRLKEIRKSLDNILEESRKRTSQAAKSRPAPSVGPSSKSSKKKSKWSSSRGGDGAPEGRSKNEYWTWDDRS